MAEQYKEAIKSRATLQAIASILWGDGPDSEWDSETIEDVAQVVQDNHPEIYAIYQD
jgi:hypothetical protein